MFWLLEPHHHIDVSGHARTTEKRCCDPPDDHPADPLIFQCAADRIDGTFERTQQASVTHDSESLDGSSVLEPHRLREHPSSPISGSGQTP